MRGIVYSMMALLLFSVLLSTAISQSAYFLRIESRSIGKMASDSMAGFQFAVERDLEKALDVSSRRAIVTAVNYIAANGEYLEDAEDELAILTLNGTLNGTEQLIMQNNSLENWADNVEARANELGLNFTITFNDINVSLEDAFTIKFELSANLTLSDKLERSSFSRQKEASVLVSIDGFEDPLYTINTDARVLRAVHAVSSSPVAVTYATGSGAAGYQHGSAVISPGGAGTDSILICQNASTETLTGFVGVVSECISGCLEGVGIDYVAGASGATSSVPGDASIYIDAGSKGVHDFSGLFDMIGNGLYNVSEDGASFLDRLEGNLNNTRCPSCGLESFVNLLDLSANDLTVKSDQSVLDYLYFSNDTYSADVVRGVSHWSSDSYYPWFKIDSSTATLYGLASLKE